MNTDQLCVHPQHEGHGFPFFLLQILSVVRGGVNFRGWACGWYGMSQSIGLKAKSHRKTPIQVPTAYSHITRYLLHRAQMEEFISCDTIFREHGYTVAPPTYIWLSNFLALSRVYKRND
jgi:hypothetical protein